MSPKLLASPAEYAAAFDTERARVYPVVDRFEGDAGCALSRDRLEAAARILACPVKDHGANWQHGRILYAAARRYLASRSGEPVLLLDIGTAKGFSALCLQWALDESSAVGAVVSVDVLDPMGTERRNSVLECDGPKTLAQFLEPWTEAQRITFLKSTGLEWLKRHPARVNLAFIDGKHTGAVVYEEGRLLGARQEPGDLAIFDDLQIDGVAAAVKQLTSLYTVQELRISAQRGYAIGVRR